MFGVRVVALGFAGSFGTKTGGGLTGLLSALFNGIGAGSLIWR
ncbi:hypothetical protein [Paenibacillus alvei]|nr:hypothetical protein [Paenibacillus alvei]